MVGSIYGYTAAYRFTLVDYNVAGWHTYEYKNWRSVDALLNSFVTLLNYTGMWDYNVSYTATQLAADEQDSLLYKCLIPHVSPASGTFAAHRAANPTYWTAIDQTVFDAVSVRLLKRANRLNQEASARLAQGMFNFARVEDAIADAQTAAGQAIGAATNIRSVAGLTLQTLDTFRHTKKIVNGFNPANIAFYSQVFS